MLGNFSVQAGGTLRSRSNKFLHPNGDCDVVNNLLLGNNFLFCSAQEGQQKKRRWSRLLWENGHTLKSFASQVVCLESWLPQAGILHGKSAGLSSLKSGTVAVCVSEEGTPSSWVELLMFKIVGEGFLFLMSRTTSSWCNSV